MARNARTGEETLSEIRRMWQDPEQPKFETIATECGVSINVVIDATADLPRREAWREKQRLRMIELGSTGMYERDIAREVKAPLRTVIRVLRAAGVSPNAIMAAKREATT